VGVNLVFVSLLAACCVYAWWGGGAPERIGAAILAVGSALSHIAALHPQRFHSVELGILLVDVAAFFAFLALSLRANRFWTLWVTGLIGVGIAGHLAMKLSPHILPYAYRFVLSAWSYPMVALIAIGTWNHRKRVRLCGGDSSWSPSSSRDGPAMPAPPRGD
jgi:hypothetical protein